MKFQLTSSIAAPVAVSVKRDRLGKRVAAIQRYGDLPLVLPVSDLTAAERAVQALLGYREMIVINEELRANALVLIEVRKAEFYGGSL